MKLPSRILIIEDEILIQQSLKLFFEYKGVQVDAVAQGKEALELILKNDYDRILCDLMLSDITGFDVFEESLQKYNRQQLTNIFVFMSAYNSAEVLAKISKYNCMFISKPFDKIEITIDKILGL